MTVAIVHPVDFYRFTTAIDRNRLVACLLTSARIYGHTQTKHPLTSARKQLQLTCAGMQHSMTCIDTTPIDLDRDAVDFFTDAAHDASSVDPAPTASPTATRTDAHRNRTVFTLVTFDSSTSVRTL